VYENKNFDKRNFLDVFNRDVKMRNIQANVNSRKNTNSFRNIAGKMSVGYKLNSARSIVSSPINNPEQAKAKAGRSFKEKFNMYGYKKSDVVLAHNKKPNQTYSNTFQKRAASMPKNNMMVASRPTTSTNLETMSPTASIKN
jgi:hypothetical protein